ncbi:uncharacterized protein LOC123504266 isoform X3 [Portunus trituberculatus]|uniref:uncharacterized protein LOC123504266 isoform X3 n=1 Tax=Portunus trituberculatus TaxID=210409 RepID=UPI001E1CEB28|nr:uncharacterized protein LOC123504266 isoform X3 [Portunus trituberculatus]
MEWRLTTVGAGRPWPPSRTDSLRTPRDYKLPHTDSGQNSLEYWDYTVELEMLKGPEDLQLAAELGKTLLERNRELEVSLKQQQAVVDDQLQEIEYLSKQTAALREVNDSRLRIYEQLEVSIQDLEKNNQRLAAEGASDKRKIKSLSSTVESLELRCDELQKNLEEARTKVQQQNQQQRGRNKRRSLLLEEQSIRRSQSCENSPQVSDECALEDPEVRKRLEELQEKLKATQLLLATETRRKEELEIQLACTSQENSVLLDQLAVLREKELNVRTFDDELASLDDTSSGRICRKCLGNVDELGSNPTLYDLNDSIEDTDASIESIHGECALIRLKNGGYAWGSQESLASIGQVVNRVGSGGTSPGTEASDAPHNSLLSELDTSYRILIEKYEALLEAREQQQQQQQQQLQQQQPEMGHEGLVHPGVDDMSGPMSLMMTDSSVHNTTLTTKCQRCNTCACDLKPAVVSHSKGSNLEEFSEVETSSSGFSDGESRLINKGTQTGEELLQTQADILDDLTPTVHAKCLDLSSPINPCDRRFQTTPEYKKLFQEIFTVLKKTVDEQDTQTQSSKPSKTPQKQDITKENSVTEPISSKDDHNGTKFTGQTMISPLVEGNETVKSPLSEVKDATSTQNIPPTQSKPCEEKEIVTVSKSSDAGITECLNSDDKREGQTSSTPESWHHNMDHRPLRPDSLDLSSGGGSRPSSRQRRRRKRHQIMIQTVQVQHQHQQQQQHTDNNWNSHQPQYQAHYNRQSYQRHQRRDRDGLHHPNHHNYRQPDDFPDLHNQPDGGSGENGKTRVVYNSSRGGGRCDHHRSRKHRRSQQENTEQKHSGSDTDSKGKPTTQKINYPSVEVAKLRRLEMTYAEVLKNSMNRSFYNRRY